MSCKLFPFNFPDARTATSAHVDQMRIPFAGYWRRQSVRHELDKFRARLAAFEADFHTGFIAVPEIGASSRG